MSYKLLNKTAFSSALLALICLSGNQSFAQELFNQEDIASAQKVLDEKNVAEPAADDISFEIEDDIIPLDEDELFTIPTQEEPVISKEDPAPKEEVTPQVQDNTVDEIQDKTDSNDALKTKKDEQKGIDEEADIKKDKEDDKQKKETIKSPDETVEDDFADNFEIDFNDNDANAENETEDLFEQIPEVEKEALPAEDIQNKPALKTTEVRRLKGKNLSDKGQPESGLKFGDSILVQTNNDLFNQMSDIEKQTTLLSLELKRERIRNEVEAAKAVREKAEYEKRSQEEAKKRQEAEWKNQQALNMVKAQEELKQKEIELEKVKQRKALTAYMNSMLEQKQLWIAENGKLYDEIKKLKETNSALRASYKNDLNAVQAESSKILNSADTARNNYERAVASLTAQNAQLRKRIETMEKASKADANPFANKSKSNNQISTSADALIRPVNISKEYAIMEITGQGDELFVKLINKEGDSFVAKTGTILNTGHMIEEITPNYVQFDRNGLKDFLYTATSALSSEPSKLTEEEEASSARENTVTRPRTTLISDDSLPSVGNSMFVK